MNFLLVALFHLSNLLVTFYSLCIMCDEHLVPAVEVFIKQFQVPEEVAGLPFVVYTSTCEFVNAF
jgi:hypothetical protein